MNTIRIKQELLKWKEIVTVKEQRNNLITVLSESLIFVGVLAAWLVHGFIPLMLHVSAYEKVKDFDHILAIAGISGACLPFVIILTVGAFYIGKYNAKLWGYLLK